jgi:hypothetical protein
MASQPTNPKQPTPAAQKTGGVQLPQFHLQSSQALQYNNSGDSLSLNNSLPAIISTGGAQKTHVAPRLHPGEPLTEQAKSPIADDFRRPIKRVAFLMGTLFLSILLISFIFNAIAGLFQRNNVTPEVAASSPAVNPVVMPKKDVTTSNLAKANTDQNACTGIPTKMQKSQVSSRQVDRVFWQKHPEWANKTLDLSAPGDRDLRQEWCQIAGDLSSAQQ